MERYLSTTIKITKGVAMENAKCEPQAETIKLSLYSNIYVVPTIRFQIKYTLRN